MDQLKEFLKQAIKYRFWIVVGVSALLPMIAYFVAAGSLQAETDTKTGEIQAAFKGTDPYKNGTLPNRDYKPLVEERTAVLSKDVDQAWRKLYERQAPLLTWPPEVTDRFHEWGEQWPKNVDDAAISAAINDWVQVYPAYVTQVYKSFRPFNYEDGSGVVAAPSEVDLLHPATYTVENPPTLGKVWATQKKLWIQRTVLDVVDKVNAQAKDWDTALIKQVNLLEVANPVAQDQRSAAKGQALKLAPEILNPNAPPAATSGAAAAPTSGAAAGIDMGKMAAMGAAGGGGAASAMFAGGGMGGGSAAASAADEVYIFEPKAGTTPQYDIVPVHLSVLIDQNRIPDLIVTFQNSPMAIQVLDFEMNRPTARVKKPVMGEDRPAGMSGMMGGMGGAGGMSAMMAMGGGGMMGDMMKMGGSGYASGGSMSAAMANTGNMMMRGGAGGAPEVVKPKGTDVSAKNLQAAREKEKAKARAKGASKDATKKVASAESKVSDPYYNIIEVRIFGQARFYKMPPAPAAEPTSPGAAPEAAPADAPKADAPKADEPKKDEPAKADAAPATGVAPATDAPKPDAPKADAPAPKADAPSPDAQPKADAAPKADAPADADTKAAPKGR